MKNYKRSPIDREDTFKATYYECHACNDSGIMHNSDGLINHHLPDYDIDGQIISHGYRDSDGHIRNNVGVDIPIDIVREIHNIRKENWIKTTKLMNQVIAKNIKNQKTKLPPEVQKVKDQLANFTIKSL